MKKIKRMVDSMRKHRAIVSDGLILLGAAATAAGVGMIYAPAGVITGGLLLAAVGWLIGTGGDSG